MEPITTITHCILLPFWGTTVGAACVLLLRGGFHPQLQRTLAGFAAGVMTAASFWSLLAPAIEQSAALGPLAFLPAAAGVWAGAWFLLVLDAVVPSPGEISGHVPGNERCCISEREISRTALSGFCSEPETRPTEPVCRTLKRETRRTNLLVLAVTLHNIPEGMAVGVGCAALLCGRMSQAAALALALGIAVQNIPEGAIVALPLREQGKGRAFLWGVLSGAVEPVTAALTVLAAGVIAPLLPFLLSFAAGAMLWVVVAELVPEMTEGQSGHLSALAFTLGFTLMMALDVGFG